MLGVHGGSLHEFFHSVGEHGGDLCGAFPAGLKAAKGAIHGKAEPRDYGEAAAVIALILRIPAKANTIPKGSRTAFRAEAEHHRSEATLAFRLCKKCSASSRETIRSEAEAGCR
jgi:hypothetical protein